MPKVTVRNARDILMETEYREEHEIFIGHPGIFVDHFRYKLLYERGGWWIDTDVLLLNDLYDRGLYYAYQDEHIVNNAVMCFPKAHAVMWECWMQAEIIRKRETVAWGETGPYLLTQVLANHGMLDQAIPREQCYPLDFESVYAVFYNGLKSEVEHSLTQATFLHLWNAKLPYGIDKYAIPEPGSWLRDQVDKLFASGEWEVWQRWSQPNVDADVL